MPKKGNYAGINELRESVYFRPHAQVQDDESSSSQKEASVAPVDASISAQTSESNDIPTLPEKDPKKTIKNKPNDNAQTTPPVSPPARTPVRRTITRYAFEFFQDQIESLRTFSLEEKTRGEKGSMSEMVREAIDAYLAKRHRLND